jgi:hypothetical protein
MGILLPNEQRTKGAPQQSRNDQVAPWTGGQTMNTVRPALHLLCAVLVLVALNDAAPAAVAKKHHAPFTKGQGQLAGGNGIFGQVYSLKSGFNFEILSAKYSLEPYDAYSSFSSGDGKKLLILDIAIKNNQSSDNFFNDEGMFTVEDSTGQLYGSHSQRLVSLGTKGVNTNLRPGQGLGQPALHDPYEEAFQIDSKSRIV